MATERPVTTAESEPEPEVAVIRGENLDYCHRHPEPAEVPLVVGVADVEVDLALDRGLKGRIYARASIPIYWIVNLMERRLEIYGAPTGPVDAPRYARREDHGPGEDVPVVIGGRQIGRVPVRELLPPDGPGGG